MENTALCNDMLLSFLVKPVGKDYSVIRPKKSVKQQLQEFQNDINNMLDEHDEKVKPFITNMKRCLAKSHIRTIHMRLQVARLKDDFETLKQISDILTKKYPDETVLKYSSSL